MKQLFSILITLLISTALIAQKNFEGTVTYRLHSNTGDKPDAELRVLFGNRKLKLLFKEKDEYEKDALVVLLDSAAVYNVNFLEKKFKKTSLTLSSPSKKPEKKLINGYTTTPFLPENTGINSLLGGMLGASSIVFYVADSLHYYIPEAFAGNKELLIIQQNRIVLGAEIQIISPYNEPEDSNSKSTNIITAEAIDIRPMTIDENEFFIPADFVDSKNIPDAGTVDSTVVVAVDTVVATVPAKKAAKKKTIEKSF